MATEIVTLRVRDDFTVDACEQALTYFNPPPKGLQACRWGRAIGEANTVVWILNWDSVADHEAYIKAPNYPTFYATIMAFCTAPVSLYHTHLRPFPPTKAFETGLLEITVLAKRLDLSHEQFQAALHELLELVTSASGYQSHFIGMKHEDPEVYVGFFGWDSVETANKVQLASLVDSMIVPENSSFTHVKLHPQ